MSKRAKRIVDFGMMIADRKKEKRERADWGL